jgi:predicted nucleic-acid-binding protein
MDALDTNVLLRWLVRDEAQQFELADRLLSTGRHRVDDACLLKVIFVLGNVYKLKRRTVADSIDFLMQHAHLDMDRVTWKQILEEYSAHPKLSPIDVYLAVRADMAGTLPLQTFDKKLADQMHSAQLVQ